MFSDFTVFEGLFCHTDESPREEEGQASQQGTAGGLTAVSDLGTPESGPKAWFISHSTPSASLELNKEHLTRHGLSNLNGWSIL